MDPQLLSVLFCYHSSVPIMLDSTFDFITQAVSNSLFMFCFCNIIIIIILIQFKQSPNLDQENEIPLSTSTATSINNIQRAQAIHIVVEEGASEFVEMKAAADHMKSIERWSCSNYEKECLGEEEREEEDELRRRIEEFIDKVNKGWKIELSRTPHFL